MADRESALMARQQQVIGPSRGEAHSELVAAFGRALVERDMQPRLIAEASGRLLWSSPNAERLLRSPFPVYLRNRRLCFEEGEASRDGEAFLGSLNTERRRLFVTNRQYGYWVLVSGWAQQATDRQLLFLTFNLSQPVTDCVSSGLAARFGLTKAEAAVLDELARLRSPAEIAQELRVKMNTVRTHLKRLHAKMAVNSNIRLLQIVRAFGDS